jgi:phosphoribosylamine--glycine ligase
MEGDKGPQTGCMGNVVFLSEGDRLTDLVLEPLTPLLRKEGYVGPIDVNCIIANDGVYFLEFTTRFGYDAIQALSELFKIPLFDFLYGIASKQCELKEREDYLNMIAIAVRLTLPPYPAENVDKWRNIKVLEIEPAARRHVWLSDVIRKNNDEVVGGVDGVIGCVTARGESIRECKRRVYRTIDNIVINQDVQFRRDIARNFEDLKDRFDRWCDAKNSEGNPRAVDQDFI